MSLEWEEIVVDAGDPRGLARWWREALGWVAVNEEEEAEGLFEIRRTPDRLPSILFVGVEEPKVVKNRLHFDFRPDNQEKEVERLLALGATRVDIGLGDDAVYWVVLADPEGNEFCVLRPSHQQATVV